MSMAIPESQPGPNPRAVRDALLPEDLDAFDAEYRQAMADAAQSLDLNPVLALVERWRRIGMSSQDPRAHRRMRETVARLQAGEDIPTESWAQTMDRFGVK